MAPLRAQAGRGRGSACSRGGSSAGPPRMGARTSFSQPRRYQHRNGASWSNRTPAGLISRSFPVSHFPGDSRSITPLSRARAARAPTNALFLLGKMTPLRPVAGQSQRGVQGTSSLARAPNLHLLASPGDVREMRAPCARAAQAGRLLDRACPHHFRCEPIPAGTELLIRFTQLQRFRVMLARQDHTDAQRTW
jgi:hypothetical protein